MGLSSGGAQEVPHSIYFMYLFSSYACSTMGESTFSSELHQHVSPPIPGNEDPLPLAQFRDHCHRPEHSGEKESVRKI